jgi:antitoxin component YwqK of YwqJK toxin-antitoxin module
MKKKSKFKIVNFSLLFILLPCFLFARNNEWAEFFQKRYIYSYAVQGNIHWIGTGFGLLKYNSENKEIKYLYHINNIQTAIINDIAISKDGSTWFVVNKSSLLYFNGNTWIHYSPNTNNFPKGKITHITTDDSNNLWAIINNGLMKFDREKWSCYSQIPLKNKYSYKVNDIIFNKGIIWVHSFEGLAAFNNGQWQGLELQVKDNLEKNKRFVQCTDNSLLIYSCGKIYDVLIDSVITIEPLEIEANLWSTTSFKVDDQGIFWIAQHSGDCGDSPRFYKVENKKVILLESISVGYDGYDYIKQIEEDDQGDLWLITTINFYKFTNNKLNYIKIWNVNIPFHEINGLGSYLDILNLKGHGELINNQEEGYWIYLNEKNQVIKEGEYKAGKKISIWKTYFDNGSIKKIIGYENGFKDGHFIEYYKNGSKKNETFYSHGKLNGKWIYWDENGIERMKTEYKDNLKNGLWFKYDTEGKLKERGEYQNNKKHGLWLNYFEDGCYGEVEFQNGKEISEWNYWNSNDKPIYSLEYPNIIKLPNKFNENRKKQGLWITFMGYRFIPLDSIKDAVFYRIAEYKDGIPQGIVRDYFMDGTLQFEGKMISEFPSIYADGTIRIYDYKGNLKTEREYKNGIKNGIEKTSFVYSYGTHYVNRRVESVFKKGKKNGLEEIWDNDEFISKGHYIDDLKEGHWMEIKSNKRYEGEYIYGERDGLWKVFSDGKQISIDYYENGIGLKPIDLHKMNPMSFLQVLEKSNTKPFCVFPISASEWKLKLYLNFIVEKIESKKRAASVVSSETLIWPEDKTSTVGHEAMFLLEGFIKGKYPPTECSVIDFYPDPEYYKKWWNEYDKKP